MQRENPKKILMIRFSAIGDILFALPALSALRERFPDGEISWLVEDRASALLENHPDLKNLHVFPRQRWRKRFWRPSTFLHTIREVLSFFAILRKERYDVIIDLQGNLKSGIFLFFLRGERKIGLARGYCKEMNFLFTNERVVPPSWPLHRVERDLALLSPLGVASKPYPAHIHLTGEEKRVGEAFVKSLTPQKHFLIILHPSTSAFGTFKRWPTEKHVSLGCRIAQELSSHVIVSWGPGEKPLAEEVVDAMKGKGELAPKTSSLKELASLMIQADCFVSGDTGPLHLAALLNVPVVGLYGPKDPSIYGPYGSRQIILRKNLPCSPCTKRTCRYPECMEAITVEEVFSAVQESLRQTKASLNQTPGKKA